jgi:Flp pilus assembly pilin Flp
VSTLVTMLRGRVRRATGTGARGTSAVEYSLLVVSIAAVCAAIIFSVGVKIKATFDDTCHALANAQSQQSTQKAGNQAALRPTNVDQC